MTEWFEKRPGVPAPLLAPRAKPKPPPAVLKKLTVNVDTDKVATWWRQNAPGQNYWRAELPARHLPGVTVDLNPRSLQPAGTGVVMPEQRGNTAIWLFAANATRGILMAAQKNAGFRVLMEVDDNYLITTTHQQRSIAAGANKDWSHGLDPSKSSVPAHKKIVAFTDGVICATETLAAAYREVHDHVYVCRNSVEPADWPDIEKPNDGVFRIGYAASTSHMYDAADIARALSWAAQQPNVEVLIYGLMGVHPSYRHQRIRWTDDLAQYRKSLQLLDVGLCPLRSSAWADCKSDVKAIEYAMAGAAPVVSRTPPYMEWHDTDRALTADDPKGFLRHVKWLVANRDAAPVVADRGREYVLRDRTIQTEVERWRTACAA